MALSYKNRRGEIHYFKSVMTAKGKHRYYITKKDAGDLIDEIPDGFEIYEHPEDAKVVLRKKIENKFQKDEIEIVKKAIIQFSNIRDFIVDVKGNILTIFIGRMDEKEFIKDMQSFHKTEEEIEQMFNKLQSYMPKMRFILNDEETRKFTVQRWCYLGSLWGWINLETSIHLDQLAKAYCYHLGKESYFDLEPPELNT